MLTRKAVMLTATISACPSHRSQACPQVNPACSRPLSLSHECAGVRARPRLGWAQGGGGWLPPWCVLARGCPPGRRQTSGVQTVRPQASGLRSRSLLAAPTGRPAARLAHRVSGLLPPQGPRAPPSPTQAAAASRAAVAFHLRTQAHSAPESPGRCSPALSKEQM